MDSLQKSFFGLKSFIGESEVLSNYLHPLLAEGSFPAERKHYQADVVANELLCKHRSGESPSHFRVSIHAGFFPHKYVMRSIKLLPVCEVLNVPEASYDRNINKHNRKAD